VLTGEVVTYELRPSQPCIDKMFALLFSGSLKVYMKRNTTGFLPITSDFYL